MPIFKCKMCGGDLDINENDSVCRCGYCGTQQTVPSLNDDRKMRLFDQAESLRRKCEFDKAAVLYSLVVAEFPEEAEAYWCLVLCRHGIEYVKDPSSGKRLPTCHRLSSESVLDDGHYLEALAHSDAISGRVYEAEAVAIERARSQAASLVSGNEAYDVFISYKETDEKGSRTEDSVISQELYEALSEKDLQVFLSRVSLKDHLGNEYEPLIYAALASSKVMLVVGTKPEHFEGVWVKNEWSHFLRMMESDREKTLIPCYKGMSPYKLPRELVRFQSLDLEGLGCIQDLMSTVLRLMGGETPKRKVDTQDRSSALSTRGMMALEDGDFSRADSFFERALDANPFDGYAYLGKFLTQRQAASLDAFGDTIMSYDDDRNFQRALKHADSKLKKALLSAIKTNESNISRAREAEERAAQARKEEEEKRIREERALRDYNKVCAEIEKTIKEELKPELQSIEMRYTPDMDALRKQMGEAESNSMKEQVRLQLEISRLQRERNSKGLFGGPNKKVLSDRITEMENRLNSLTSQQDIRNRYQPRIDELALRMEEDKQRAESAVRKRHPVPSFETFRLAVEHPPSATL